jgi:23S rRNA (cytidine1920-2'-O)/16S rRNA (cytidine1409-2'-O)-methyltransferase
MAGRVTVGERSVSKPGTLVDEESPLSVTEGPRYVSRGGEKLEHALRVFGVEPRGFVAADVGASTGGFTDCLLRHGASKVYAIDVGRGQLAHRLRRDPRVVVMERINVRHLEGLPEPVHIATVDVSFISLRLVLPVVAQLLEGGDQSGPRGTIIALFKPQFEANRGDVPRGGVIKDRALQAVLIGRFVRWCVGNAFRVLDLTASPLLGADGNREFFFWLKPLWGLRR